MSNKIDLLSPFNLGTLALPNRMVMAPMTRNRAGPGEVPSDLALKYYTQRAGAGLIVTEGTQISQQGQGYPGTPGIFNKDQVASWKRITNLVHAAGGRILRSVMARGPYLTPIAAARRRSACRAIGNSASR